MKFSLIRFLGCTRFRAGRHRLRLTPWLLFPAGRLAQSNPVRHVRNEFPLRATCFRRVLPHVVGFPHLRVGCSIRLPIRIRPAFPVTVLLRLPGALSASKLRFRHRSVSGFPLTCPNSRLPYCDTSHSQELMGPPKFFDASLPACHGLWTPADLHSLANAEVLVLPSVCVKTLGVRNTLMSKLYQLFRVRGHPYGLQDSLSTLRPSCSPCERPRLRHGRKTRYGWMANPFPTRAFTRQDAPSLSWRCNAGAHRLPEAEAT